MRLTRLAHAASPSSFQHSRGLARTAAARASLKAALLRHPCSPISSLATATKMPSYPITPYTQARHSSFPYTASDFAREDPRADTSFYISPRFVTHIDDAAIAALQAYYAAHLPSSGRILDLCSSWISHLPDTLAANATATAERQRRAEGVASGIVPEATPLEVVGVGLNEAELRANPVLGRYRVQDLNASPVLQAADIGGKVDAAVCVVSIDYLTQARETLASVRGLTRTVEVSRASSQGADAEGNPRNGSSRDRGVGTIHLVISNRCFPTKAVARWLRISEEERLLMVADYLWWSGWRSIEIVTLCDGRAGTDPLWVVRGQNEGDR